MIYSAIGIIWILVATFYGALSMGIGPGVVMLFCGMILGFSGGVIHWLISFFNISLKWYYTGFIISVLSVLFTMVFMGGDTLKPEIILFLWLFYIIPSYVIYLMVEKFRCWIISGK